MEYHTQWQEPAVESDAVDFFRWGDSVAFVHDITDPWVPHWYGGCDIIYSELPWPYGLPLFYDRAGRTLRRSHRSFLDHLNLVTKSLTIPRVFITGAHARAALTGFESILNIELNGEEMLAYCDGLRPHGDHATASELLSEVVDRFGCIGDPCCGFGRVARAATRRSRTFVCSDINGQCIGYLKNRVHKWGK